MNWSTRKNGRVRRTELGMGGGRSGVDEIIVRRRANARRERRDRFLVAVLKIIGPPDRRQSKGGRQGRIQAFRDFEVGDRLARPPQDHEKPAAVEISFGIARIEFDGTTNLANREIELPAI